MQIRSVSVTAALCAVVVVPSAHAQSPQGTASSPQASQREPAGAPPETVSLFGWHVPQDERFALRGTFIAGWSHDGAQAQLGLEKQGRVAQATLTVSGRISDRLRYLVSFNPVNEVPSKPACGEEHFFFPNDPSFYAAGPVVPCDPEDGSKRVDTYNTYALDYLTQQGPLREGYVDWRASDAISARFGRFILPIGFAPLEAGSWTSKDLTRIQRLNAEANFGLMLGYTHRNASGEPLAEANVMGVLGEGNREKDYDWFYFVNTSLDTNSALTVVGSLRARPHRAVDLRAAYKRGFTGSKVERLPSYWASKRIDDALVVSAKVQVHAWVSVFGEYARYVWGPTATSAEMLELDQNPIDKPGYYIGGTFEIPVTDGVTAGITFTREEVSRDDSLVKYLALNGLYGVEMGKKDRGTIARFHVDVSRLVTFGVFWADISNPYPWISGSWPIAGPRAFTGRAPDRYGLAVVVRTP
ncbi:MAG TPA: hypothetical protein VMO26_28985 [Vicinamibacterales bacterium]|nr:hypothetical protein [Vicinamibacterales bacterium]